MTFSRARRIRFSDCDPAGIVFYPQYFVLFNDLLEDWVDSIFADGFAGCILRRRFGMPVVRLEAEFKQVSRMGDDVTLCLSVTRVGQRSLDLSLQCIGVDGSLRMWAKKTLVTTSLDTHSSIPIPLEFRRAVTEFSEATGPAPGATT